ncbi:TauD/TfdA family dioxygenase [Frankia sp. AgB32]|uniref:TauD/TfdA family dioxygenase n=1 Tax=Frankia sp. AgB32 TaxID=631119 RepID=UPI00200D9A8E|nr:TauD/TfdA family dioxygenase [Frankia sp. AgB32]MCK9896351.1 TauD/TfdA family dioxygenase [Frankia sp. AgB32]
MTGLPRWRPHSVRPPDGGRTGAAGLLGHLASIDLDELLIREKALVFRGFDVRLSDFDRVVGALLPNRLAYVHGNSLRTRVGRDIYTSTEYPHEYVISMHNEMSYAARWPSRLLFYCEAAAAPRRAPPRQVGRA